MPLHLKAEQVQIVAISPLRHGHDNIEDYP